MKQLLEDGVYPCGKGQGWIHISNNGNDLMWTTHKEHNDQMIASAIAVVYKHDKLYLACKSYVTMYLVGDEEAKEIEKTIKEKMRLAYIIEKRQYGKKMPAILLEKNDIFYFQGEKWRVKEVHDDQTLVYKTSWSKKDAIVLSRGHDVIFVGKMSKLRALFVL